MHSYPNELLWIPWGMDYGACKTGDCVPAVFLSSPGARYLVLYLHSNGEDIGLCYPFGCGLRMMLEVHVLLIEYPGYGICPGHCSEESLWQAAASAFRFITEVLQWPAEDVIVMGRSLGAAIATRLAQSFVCHGLILVAPFLSLVDAVRQYVGRLAPLLVGDIFSNQARIKGVDVPTLVIHGQQDRLIPHDQGRQLLELCPHQKKLLVCPEDMGHNCDLLSSPEFLIRPMLRFFSLPDYVFVDPNVPDEAFNKRLCPQYHGLVEMAKDDTPLLQPQGDQEPVPACTTTEGPQCFVRTLQGNEGDLDDLEGSQEFTVRTPRSVWHYLDGNRGVAHRRRGSSVDRAVGMSTIPPMNLHDDVFSVAPEAGDAAFVADPVALAFVADPVALEYQSTTVASSPAGPSDSTESAEEVRSLPGLHLLDIDNGISRFLDQLPAEPM